MKKMNVPNTLSLIRALLVPVFVATLLFMRNIPIWCCIVPTIVYALRDMYRRTSSILQVHLRLGSPK